MFLSPTQRRIMSSTRCTDLMLDKVNTKLLVAKRNSLSCMTSILSTKLASWPVIWIFSGDFFHDVQPFIQSALDGFNVSFFAYGQNHSGKTHTMVSPPLFLSQKHNPHHPTTWETLHVHSHKHFYCFLSPHSLPLIQRYLLWLKILYINLEPTVVTCKLRLIRSFF